MLPEPQSGLGALGLAIPPPGRAAAAPPGRTGVPPPGRADIPPPGRTAPPGLAPPGRAPPPPRPPPRWAKAVPVSNTRHKQRTEQRKNADGDTAGLTFPGKRSQNAEKRLDPAMIGATHQIIILAVFPNKPRPVLRAATASRPTDLWSRGTRYSFGAASASRVARSTFTGRNRKMRGRNQKRKNGSRAMPQNRAQ